MGPRGPEFESLHSDQKSTEINDFSGLFYPTEMARRERTVVFMQGFGQCQKLHELWENHICNRRLRRFQDALVAKLIKVQ